mgnify:FL=1
MKKKSNFIRINKWFLTTIIILTVAISLWLGGKMFVIFHTDIVVDHYVEYNVSADDTLSGIASKFKMDGEKDYRRQLYEIKKANDINDDSIRCGETLQIPVFIHVVK